LTAIKGVTLVDDSVYSGEGYPNTSHQFLANRTRDHGGKSGVQTAPKSHGLATAQFTSHIVSQQPVHDCTTKSNTHNYYTYLMAFFSRTTWVSWHQKGKPFWIPMKQEMMG